MEGPIWSAFTSRPLRAKISGARSWAYDLLEPLPASHKLLALPTRQSLKCTHTLSGERVPAKVRAPGHVREVQECGHTGL